MLSIRNAAHANAATAKIVYNQNGTAESNIVMTTITTNKSFFVYTAFKFRLPIMHK